MYQWHAIVEQEGGKLRGHEHALLWARACPFWYLFWFLPISWSLLRIFLFSIIVAQTKFSYKIYNFVICFPCPRYLHSWDCNNLVFNLFRKKKKKVMPISHKWISSIMTPYSVITFPVGSLPLVQVFLWIQEACGKRRAFLVLGSVCFSLPNSKP